MIFRFPPNQALMYSVSMPARNRDDQRVVSQLRCKAFAHRLQNLRLHAQYEHLRIAGRFMVIRQGVRQIFR